MSQEQQTATVIHRFNQAFLQHDAALLEGIVADDCVMESVEPAPDGTRYEGRRSCLSFWQALARDAKSSFELEDVVIASERAIIRWRFRFGDGGSNSVRGVNLMRVRDGQIVEALGYTKSGATEVAGAIGQAMDRR